MATNEFIKERQPSHMSKAFKTFIVNNCGSIARSIAMFAV